MGKVLSIITLANPLRNFNVESRAHKVISQAKPSAAPKHKIDQAEIDRLIKDYPNAYDESLKKDANLDKNLKDIYVTSHDVVPDKPLIQDPNRPLPTDRTTPGLFLYGMKEPDKVPLGKASLRQILEIISKHQNDPRIFTVQNIAEELQISEEKTRNILKYYKVFELYMPQERNVKAKFAGPSVPRVHIIKEIKKQLPSKTEEKEKT